MVIYGFLVGLVQVSDERLFKYEFCLGGQMNDLWIYDGVYWTWMSGSSSTKQPGSYGEKGVASSFNVPGARNSATGWKDKEGNLWIIGGNGYDEISSGLQVTAILQRTSQSLCRFFE
jgi:hypothetical protein